MKYLDLPKIELHLHLDCSLSYDVVKTIDPSISLDDYQKNFVAPAKCNDLADYIKRADQGLKLMQSQKNLELIVSDLFDKLKEDNVIYAEIRYAPLLHLREGLTATQVVQIVNDAVTEASLKTGVKGGIILCTLRHYTEEESMQTVQLVEQFSETNVVGFDIAADEAGFPIDNHIKAFEYAHAKNINCTAHAGEAKGADSVWETLKNFKPSRIGHGIRSIEDLSLIQYLKEEGIHLEICPTSNVQTNVYSSIEEHRINEIYEHNVSMSINTDARSISNVSLTSEYNTLEKVFNWEKAHFLACNLHAVNAAFTTDDIKVTLKEQLLKAY